MKRLLSITARAASLALALAAWLTLAACPTKTPSVPPAGGAAAVLRAGDAEDDGLELHVDDALHARVVERRGGKTRELSARAPLLALTRADGKALALTLQPAATQARPRASGDDAWPFGAGREYTLKARGDGVAVALSLALLAKRPVALVRARVVNTGKAPLSLARVRLAGVSMPAGASAQGGHTWVFQGAALAWSKDYIFQLRDGHESRNFMGATRDQSGGGTPLNYVWRRGGGLAIAHVETRARSLYLPLAVKGGRAHSAVESTAVKLAPGASWTSVRAALIAGHGDFYKPVATYRALLAQQGLAMPSYPVSAYRPIWCSWGYEFDVGAKELTGVLPKLASLGFGWSVIDDRWFVGYGDWTPRAASFGKDPVAGLERVVAATHKAGLLAKLWWIPILVERSGRRFESHTYKTPPVLAKHPDWVILDKRGKPALGIRKLEMLCPALPAVQQHTRALVRRFIGQWGFDGHKLDVIYAVPPCHNPKHKHKDPAESSRAMADIYRVIYEETKKLKPHAVTEICPCGTTPHFIWVPYMNQAVTADPRGARQVRHRIKLLKALMGPRGAVYADHVELTRIRNDHQVGADFAAAIGTGGIVGSKLIYPRPTRKLSATNDLLLTSGREKVFRRWLAVYNRVGLASAKLRGDLYDVAFDKPETHAIEKKGVMHYAFYSAKEDGAYSGEVELRGLAPGRYRVRDYVAGKDIGSVTAGADGKARLKVAFTNALLVKAVRAR